MLFGGVSKTTTNNSGAALPWPFLSEKLNELIAKKIALPKKVFTSIMLISYQLNIENFLRRTAILRLNQDPTFAAWPPVKNP
ncbi:MAG: hypothetical protein NZM15_04195 [Flavobacteriales bacterium]|nr:hypothetical protein [Flavobacteriales bacterium]MDW8431886.1 hypothetical protein [Flavobacteriales bacterium]